MNNCSPNESLGEYIVHYLDLLPEYKDHQIESANERERFIGVLNWLGIK